MEEYIVATKVEVTAILYIKLLFQIIRYTTNDKLFPNLHGLYNTYIEQKKHKIKCNLDY